MYTKTTIAAAAAAATATTTTTTTTTAAAATTTTTTTTTTSPLCSHWYIGPQQLSYSNYNVLFNELNFSESVHFICFVTMY
jgi:hypothetical protein